MQEPFRQQELSTWFNLLSVQLIILVSIRQIIKKFLHFLLQEYTTWSSTCLLSSTNQTSVTFCMISQKEWVWHQMFWTLWFSLSSIRSSRREFPSMNCCKRLILRRWWTVILCPEMEYEGMTSLESCHPLKVQLKQQFLMSRNSWVTSPRSWTWSKKLLTWMSGEVPLIFSPVSE